jgi:hypothetical protein
MSAVTVERSALASILHHVQDADASLLGKPGVSDAMASLRRAALELQAALGQAPAAHGEAGR